MDRALEHKGAQDSRLILMHHSVRVRVRQRWQGTCENEQGAHGKNQIEEESLQNMEKRSGNLGGI